MKLFIIIILILLIIVLYLKKRYTINSVIKDRIIRQPKNQKIPKVIIQSLSQREVTQSIKDASDSWKKLNPSYTYKFFTDDESSYFIKKYYGKEISKIYDKIYSGAYKADFFRYCYLYMFGGIWTDITSVCKTPLEEILNNDIDCFLVRDVVSGRSKGKRLHIYNSFIITTPKNPIFLEIINQIIKTLKDKDVKNLFDITGPGGLGLAFNKVRGVNPTTELPKENIINMKNMNIKFFDNYIPFWDITRYSFAKVIDKSVKPYKIIRYNKYAIDSAMQNTMITKN